MQIRERWQRWVAVLTVAFAIALANPFGAAAAANEKKKKKKSEPTRVVNTRSPLTQSPDSLPPTPPVVSPRAANGSLFTETAVGAGLLSDFKPRRVGDLVFIDVIESSTASVSSGAKRGRDSGTLGGLGALAGVLPIPGAAVAGGVAGALGSRKFEGKGSTERRSDVDARIVARVVDVLPNGDLRIEAQKVVKINKENEWLSLSGIIRQRDVSAENSVPTTAVGDLYVELNGKGVASADNAPGWLSRLFEKITPF